MKNAFPTLPKASGRPGFMAMRHMRSSPSASTAGFTKSASPTDTPPLVTISAHQKVSEAIQVMEQHSISQLPVVRDGEVSSLSDVIGSLQDRALLDLVFKNADALHEDVAVAMQGPLSAVDADASVDEIVTALTGGTNAVVVADQGTPIGVVTRSDLLEYLSHAR